MQVKCHFFIPTKMNQKIKKKKTTDGYARRKGKKRSFLYTQNLMSRDKNKMRSQISMSTNPKKGKKKEWWLALWSFTTRKLKGDLRNLLECPVKPRKRAKSTKTAITE